jgi:hypothetical protein
MVAGVFHPLRITPPGLRSRSRSRFYIYRYEKGVVGRPLRDSFRVLSVLIPVD